MNAYRILGNELISDDYDPFSICSEFISVDVKLQRPLVCTERMSILCVNIITKCAAGLIIFDFSIKYRPLSNSKRFKRFCRV